jgi:hypothetical protein
MTIKPALQGALLTVGTLFGGMLLGVVVGNLVYEALPGHSIANPSSLNVALGALPAITGILLGSASWGMAMGRMAGSQSRVRLALAGILGFVPVTILLAFLLLRIETWVVETQGDALPLQRLFTLLFVPTAFLIAGGSAGALGLGLRDAALARRLALAAGLSAAAAFLVVNLGMEATGWVVGAPNAAQRFTMLVVMFAGDLGAALAGGAAIGVLLDRIRQTG